MKPWYLSKTIWFNVITVSLGIIGQVSGIFPISDHPKLYASVIAVGNIILRFLTEKPIV